LLQVKNKDSKKAELRLTMKLFYLALILLAGCGGNHMTKEAPVAIIFDTDIAPDYDDVGALAMLHAFADKGEAKILATISSNAAETTVPTISVINTYFKRQGIPVGVIKLDSPNLFCERLWAQKIVKEYPHNFKSNNDAQDAVSVYRKLLASQPDHSVTIVTVGTFSNMPGLLDSKADEFSELTGRQLVEEKVKQLVSMAGAVDSTGKGGNEFNIRADIPAARKVFSEWPTPITLTGLEIGIRIITGMTLINNDNIQNSPVKDAYYHAMSYDGNNEGRYSWDQTAVLIAVRGLQPYFKYRELDFIIEDDGTNRVVPGKKIKYATFNQTPAEITKVIEELMMK
jgi:inosine-uridine nucleoside N-ribohydrolase